MKTLVQIFSCELLRTSVLWNSSEPLLLYGEVNINLEKSLLEHNLLLIYFIQFCQKSKNKSAFHLFTNSNIIRSNF